MKTSILIRERPTPSAAVVPEGKSRTPAQLREHYVIERELADRLRNAPRRGRAALYQQTYDELFERVTHHPQLLQRRSPGYAARRLRQVEQQLRLLKKFIGAGMTYMEVGAGDCALAIRAAAFARQVYAIDVSRQITSGLKPPSNFQLLLTDGVNIPLADRGVDFAFSDQLMEHLHPEDAAAQIREIQRVLAPGGRYLCITPNRVGGPEDISAYFDQVATGLHLKEYTAGELRRLFLENGFSAVRFYAGARGHIVPMAYLAIAGIERALASLPDRWRRRLAGLLVVRAFLGLRVMAIK